MAFKSIGLDTDSISYIEKQLGPKIALKIAEALSVGMKEDKFVGPNTATNSFGHLTPDQAQSKIKEKLQDPHFKDIYFNGKGEEHKNAVKEIERLQMYAVGI
jgi:hypothetical protein